MTDTLIESMPLYTNLKPFPVVWSSSPLPCHGPKPRPPPDRIAVAALKSGRRSIAAVTLGFKPDSACSTNAETVRSCRRRGLASAPGS
jgi:hypothetical protein